MALVLPARELANIEICGVAARERARAETFAAEHELPLVFDDYDALLASPEVDCIYNPLPNGLHCEWTIRALEAGKHVLCEKPFAANAEEAMQMAAAAERTGRILVEAVHYLYHPLMLRVREILDGDVLGRLRHVRSHFGAPFPHTNDIRFELALAGGALMDMGCYPVSAARFVAGEPEVVRAEARTGPPEVDVEIEADLRFSSGATGAVSCAMHPEAPFEALLELEGERGHLRVVHPFLPQLGHSLTLETDEGTRTEDFGKTPTFHYQLQAFFAYVREGVPMLTSPANAICTMRVIDEIYRKSGLSPRGGPSS